MLGPEFFNHEQRKIFNGRTHRARDFKPVQFGNFHFEGREWYSPETEENKVNN